MNSRAVIPILRSGGVIRRWHSGRWRLVDKKRNPVSLLADKTIRSLLSRSLIKKSDAGYVYCRPKDRELDLLPWLCSHGFGVERVVMAKTKGSAKFLFLKEEKQTYPSLEYTDINAKYQDEYEG